MGIFLGLLLGRYPVPIDWQIASSKEEEGQEDYTEAKDHIEKEGGINHGRN